MRTLVKLAIVAFGIRALLRWRKQRQAEAKAVSEAPPAADPADELRQKLAATRTEDAVEGAPAEPDATLEERRADVHEQGRAALDEMKSPDEG